MKRVACNPFLLVAFTAVMISFLGYEAFGTEQRAELLSSNTSSSAIFDHHQRWAGLANGGWMDGKGVSSELLLHSFGASGDGINPQGGLVQANNGNFYGTTVRGGAYNNGTIFKLDATSGQVTILHSFNGGVDGNQPWAGLIQATDGNLYGTTVFPGPANCSSGGTVFRIDLGGQNFAVIHCFNGSTDGAEPQGGVIQGKDGYLYGTTYAGGPNGGGTAFKMDLNGNILAQHSFGSSNDGANPTANFTESADGNFYNTTLAGGSSGAGTIFVMDSNANVTILHSISSADGISTLQFSPLCSVGNTLYGEALTGGSYSYGVIFKIDTTGQNFSVVHSFSGSDGTNPIGGLLQTNGVFYGTTEGAGSGPGEVFEMSTSGSVVQLHVFKGAPSDGAQPMSGVIQATDGNLYGTTYAGGTYNDGTIFKLTGLGAPSWQPIGPQAIKMPNGPPAAGKLQALAVENQNPKLMYAAGGFGSGNSGPYTEAGIFKTVNGGITWTRVNVGLTDHVVDSLWLSQANPNILLAGTETKGIFRSTDGGAHWALSGAFGSTSAFVEVGNTLYAATAQGVASSTDGGATWSIVKSTSAPVRALATGGGLIYAGLENGQVLVYVSGTWTTTTPANNTVWSIAINPANAQNAYVVEWLGYQNPDLYVTQNAGGSWTPISNTAGCPAGPLGGQQAQVVAYDSKGNLFAGCDFSMAESRDNGKTWNPVTGANWDVRLILTDFGAASGRVAIGSDQGIYLSKNRGSTWRGMNGNLKSSILFGLGVQGSTLLTTAQDFSPISSFDAGKTWSNLQNGAAVGESGTVVFNPGNSQYAYIFTTSGFFYSIDGGKTFTSDPQLPYTEFPQSAGNGDLIALDFLNPSTVYVAGVDGVFKSTDWGVSWTLQSSWTISKPVMVAVDPTNSNHIFVGEQGGPLMMSVDGGSTFNPSDLHCTNCGAPVSLAVDPANSQDIVIGMSLPPPNGGVLVSTDGGANLYPANQGIVQLTTTCQAAAIPHVRFDPSGSGLVAAATNSGPYVSSSLGGNWSSIRGNIVPNAVTDLVWSGGYLYASTCGEGVLRMLFSQ
jgi:uncharacterized repeat protein (TIGR03803 family)